MILVDTGPLVALVDRNDHAHDDCRLVAESLANQSLVTTWACLVEAMHLLQRAGDFPFQRALLETIFAGDVTVHDIASEHIERLGALMAKYADVPMDLADASLILAAEQLGVRTLFTLDSDFRIYRLADGAVLALLP